jgi:hypothetical protein
LETSISGRSGSDHDILFGLLEIAANGSTETGLR